MQGASVISGNGLEVVITLGTGFGSAVFDAGRLAPHIELAHHPFLHGRTYDDQLGRLALAETGLDGWNRSVIEAIATLDRLFFYDHLYIGGGNSRLVNIPVSSRVSLVNNIAGVKGGGRLWNLGA